jgi:eukaryotic-like serine/threonine-protein kinase
VPGPATPDERAKSLIGRVLSDRYRLDGIVAMGSMGAVYRGFHLKMRKEVAIKILHPETEGFPDLVARFEREAIVGAHIDHPNIAAASDMGTFDDGSYFLVLELVKGHTLRDIIDREGPLRPERAIRLTRQLASALGRAHERGVVHRDLKLLNVMVTQSQPEVVKLIDFGLARVEVDDIAPDASAEGGGRSRSVSSPGVVFGTVATMAPEIGHGMEAIDERSDLYSVGVMLYEMLTGMHPFELGDATAVLLQHRDAPVPPMAQRNPRVHVPPSIEAVTMKLLAKSPGDRYQNVAALLEALDAGSPRLDEGSIPRAFAAPPSPASEGRRRQLTIGVGAFLALALVVLLVGAFKKRSDGTASPPSDSESHQPATGEDAPSATTPPRDLAAELRADLIKAAGASDDAEGGAILLALADTDKAALKDATVRAAATKIATRIGERGGDDAAQAFYALSYRFGAAGLDVLYDVSLDEKANKARGRAQAILDVQAKTERPSPALRIVLELKNAKCRQKPLLFGRAASEGDARMLAILEKLRPPGCEPDGDACCFRRHLGLEKAIDSLRERVGPKP